MPGNLRRRRNMLTRQAMSHLALLLSVAAMVFAKNPSSAGFISIDCGLDGIASYTDEKTGIVFSSDEPYISTGVNMRVSPFINLTSVSAYYSTVRSFPYGTRSCYTLGPLQPGSKYRVTAQFLYGNYDGQLQPPKFDLHLGVNLWAIIETDWFSVTEIITVSLTDSIQVCLVNTGLGVPFISELDLRPLPFSMYNMVNDTSSSVVFNVRRTNHGGDGEISFPYDIYDRLWDITRRVDNSIKTTKRVNLLPDDRFPVAQEVLQTAIQADSLTDSLDISSSYYDFDGNQKIYVYLYFAELRKLGRNETREFSIYVGDELVYGPFRPRFLQQDVYCTPFPGRYLFGQLTYSIRATTNSTLPPILNGDEIFVHTKMPLLPTRISDVRAIMAIKKQFDVSRNWEGDPCVPRKFIWTGLMCGYDDSNYSTITSLDLSRSGLSGRIPLLIINLTSLTSLDLSYNYFTGELPDYLGEMTSLTFLNLEGNSLTGTVPRTIYQRSLNGSLLLRIGGNQALRSTIYDHSSTSKSKKKTRLISIATSVAALLVFAVIISVRIVKRKKKQNSTPPITDQEISYPRDQHDDDKSLLATAEGALQSETRQFSEVDISKITANFSKPIGHGRSGVVYHGNLDNGTCVAVKLLFKTVHGRKQFKAEAELLMRVHHRYLMLLLGYCIENMALVYEYAPQGTLADQLSGDSTHRNILNWGTRLRLALEAARGLDYLHNGCTPPIVHGDVRTTNILLSDKFEVLISDFGMSKTVSNDRNTYISTVMAGIPGYIDPEYQRSKKLSEKSDVYSFGIVLLELIMGRLPLSTNDSLTYITDEVQTRVRRGDIVDIADKRMTDYGDGSSLKKLADIALSCLLDSSTQRPCMRLVVGMLKECLKSESSIYLQSNPLPNILEVSPDSSAEIVGGD